MNAESTEKAHIEPAPAIRSRYQICDDCECVTIVQRNDSRGVPDEVDWDQFPGCMVCGGSMLHWDAEEKAQDDIYWAKGERAGRESALREAADMLDRRASGGTALNYAADLVRALMSTPPGSQIGGGADA